MHRVRGVVLVEGSKRLKLGNLLQPHHKFLVASKTPKVQQKIEKPSTSTLFSLGIYCVLYYQTTPGSNCRVGQE